MTPPPHDQPAPYACAVCGKDWTGTTAGPRSPGGPEPLRGVLDPHPPPGSRLPDRWLGCVDHQRCFDLARQQLLHLDRAAVEASGLQPERPRLRLLPGDTTSSQARKP